MAFKVTDFKTNLAAGGGGARPSLYKIDINGPGGFAGSFNTIQIYLSKLQQFLHLLLLLLQ